MKPRCPTCRKPLPDEPPPTFPFCGARCKMADLGSWLDGKYVVASPGFDEDFTSEGERDGELLN